MTIVWPSGWVLAAASGILLAAGLAVLLWTRATAAPSALALTVTSGGAVVTPRALLASPGQVVEVHNATARSLVLSTTPHAPAPLRLTVAPRASARVILTMPGLYHLYDAATAYVRAYQAGSDVVRARPGTSHPLVPVQAWILVHGTQGIPLDAHILVPNGADLLSPPVVAIRVGGTVAIHNHDTDAHNIVTDPADPAGIAFALYGTAEEPATGGAERRLTFNVAGLYHIYCTMHTRAVGQVGPWQVVVPRDKNASGYAADNPMEAWILVVPGDG
jgi:plastocyanin